MTATNPSVAGCAAPLNCLRQAERFLISTGVCCILITAAGDHSRLTVDDAGAYTASEHRLWFANARTAQLANGKLLNPDRRTVKARDGLTMTASMHDAGTALMHVLNVEGLAKTLHATIPWTLSLAIGRSSSARADAGAEKGQYHWGEKFSQITEKRVVRDDIRFVRPPLLAGRTRLLTRVANYCAAYLLGKEPLAFSSQTFEKMAL